MGLPLHSWADFWRRLRRNIKAGAPFVRRREYRVLQDKYSALIESFAGGATPACQAKYLVRKPITLAAAGEVCLFVTFAPLPKLKSHVKHHIEHLISTGIQVVLIVNLDVLAAEFAMDVALKDKLSGIILRENTGFDFGAWAHGLTLFDPTRCTRLYLINDSMVGPLNAPVFFKMMARIRASKSDFLGLTEGLAPARHLQSYFLVFNQKAIQAPVFIRLMREVLNFPDKGQVVDVYEVRLTQQLNSAGLHFEALFPSLTGDVNNADDTAIRWGRLFSIGFPYLKTRVIQQLPHHPQIVAARLAGHVDTQI